MSDNTTVLSRREAQYPPLLASIFDPPETLWIRGNPALLASPSVAIVGSRRASPYGLEVARQLGADLARRHVAVVSGMARGIDAAAHRGALDAGGATIAVLGCGIDIVYPALHRRLAADIGASGALVTEFAPGMPPLRHHFPRRNRIISGLALAVVVVEDAADSGSLITADFALEQGRAVLAVPGNVLGGRHQGAHALLRDGAKLVERADDILEEIGLAGRREPGRTQSASHDSVLAAMDPGDAYDLDEIAARSGVDRIRLLPRLLELELAGTLRRVEGGRFMRSARPC